MVESFHQVEKGLFIGNASAANNLSLLKKLNISHIVNLSGYEPRYPDQFFYLNIEISDSPRSNLKRYFDVTNYLINSVIKCGSNILVHCAAGISRSASIVIVYLLFSHPGWTPKKAFEFLKSKRSIVNPNPGFEAQINSWWYEMKSKEGMSLQEPPNYHATAGETPKKIDVVVSNQRRPTKSSSKQ